jgi:hypothetical protein
MGTFLLWMTEMGIIKSVEVNLVENSIEVVDRLSFLMDLL